MSTIMKGKGMKNKEKMKVREKRITEHKNIEEPSVGAGRRVMKSLEIMEGKQKTGKNKEAKSTVGQRKQKKMAQEREEERWERRERRAIEKRKCKGLEIWKSNPTNRQNKEAKIKQDWQKKGNKGRQERRGCPVREKGNRKRWNKESKQKTGKRDITNRTPNITKQSDQEKGKEMGQEKERREKREEIENAGYMERKPENRENRDIDNRKPKITEQGGQGKGERDSDKKAK